MQAGSNLSSRSGPARPCDFDPSVLGNAVAQVEVDKALIGNASLDCHVLEIEQDIFRKPHSDWLFEFGGIGILSGPHLGKVVFSFHDCSPP